ncbi:tektin [Caerostris extrusa]|uniref:Tektin n=1 Tax=Caerostris extrusa TaxID=172846 RepID=A0AAV4SVB7_CAEEX|nr:tektin [Caerostris extrusa]
MNTFTPQIFSTEEWYRNNQRRFNQSDISRAEWFRYLCQYVLVCIFGEQFTFHAIDIGWISPIGKQTRVHIQLYYASRVCQQSKQLAKEKKLLTETVQDDSTKKIAERAKQVFDCQKDLEKALEQLTTETRKLELRRNVYRTPLKRGAAEPDRGPGESGPQGSEGIEIEIVQTYRDLTKMIIAELENQIKRNQQSKNELERDWSDKWEAYNLDTISAHLQNTSSEQIAFYTGPQKIPNKWSSPQEWIEFTRHRLFYAKDEIRTSAILRDKINSHLQNGYKDLRNQADLVESVLAQRINEKNDSLYRLKQHLLLVSIAD